MSEARRPVPTDEELLSRHAADPDGAVARTGLVPGARALRLVAVRHRTQPMPERARRASLRRDDDVELDTLPARDGTPERMLEELQDEEALRRLLADTLDADERKALWLRCFERLLVEEITIVMRLDNATRARGLLQRARRKLRAALEGTTP